MARSKDMRDESTPLPEERALPVEATPMARALAHVLSARDLILEAQAARGDDDATADAGRLATALMAAGAALGVEQEPWPIKHAIDGKPDMADPEGADALARFVGMVSGALKHGARRKALGLGPQAGLARFAEVAVKHKVQRTAMVELEEARREEEAARQRTGQEAHERRRAEAPRPRPTAPAGPQPPENDFDTSETAKV